MSTYPETRVTLTLTPAEFAAMIEVASNYVENCEVDADANDEPDPHLEPARAVLDRLTAIRAGAALGSAPALWSVEQAWRERGARKERVKRYVVLAADGADAIAKAKGDARAQPGEKWRAEGNGGDVASLGIVFR